MKQNKSRLKLVTIEDYSDSSKTRLVQKFSYTTTNPKKKYLPNITATITKPKKGDHANAHNSKVVEYGEDGFRLISENMAEDVIYGFWYAGIIFHCVKKTNCNIFIQPTDEGVR